MHISISLDLFAEDVEQLARGLLHKVQEPRDALKVVQVPQGHGVVRLAKVLRNLVGVLREWALGNEERGLFWIFEFESQADGNYDKFERELALA